MSESVRIEFNIAMILAAKDIYTRYNIACITEEMFSSYIEYILRKSWRYYIDPYTTTDDVAGKELYIQGANWSETVEVDLISYNLSLYYEKFERLSNAQRMELFTIPRRVMQLYEGDDYVMKCKKLLFKILYVNVVPK